MRKKIAWALAVVLLLTVCLGGCAGIGRSRDKDDESARRTSQKQFDRSVFDSLFDSSDPTAQSETQSQPDASDEEDESKAPSVFPEEKQTLRVGVTDFEPFDYRDESGEWTGFDAELAQAFAGKIGADVEFIEIEWDNKLQQLNSGAVDCIWNGMIITDEIRQNASVSDPYARNAQVVVMAYSSFAQYHDTESMKGLTFAVAAGSEGATAAEQNGFENIIEVDSQSAALRNVKAGAADACIIDIALANAMTGAGTDYADYGYMVELSSEEYGAAFRTGSDLTAKLNDALREFKNDGTLAALAAKYYVTLA